MDINDSINNMRKQLQFPFMEQEYTKEEMATWTGDTNINWKLLPFWTKVKWSLFGPPGNTGPR